MWPAQHLSGNAFVAAQCIILFSLNATMMSLGRIPLLGFVPGMFFGFASYFATLFGNFGPVPGDPLVALAATIVMNAIGPIYAWLTARFGAHHHRRSDRGRPRQGGGVVRHRCRRKPANSATVRRRLGNDVFHHCKMRAARALLGIDQRVSLPTIQRMEASHGNVRGVVGSLIP